MAVTFRIRRPRLAALTVAEHSPSDGAMKDEGTHPRFDYPGRKMSLEDRSVVSETRMFFGNCALGHPDAAIWFGRWIGDDKQWHESVYLAEVKDDRLAEGQPKASVPGLREAEEAVRKSQCREFPGIDQWEEP